MRRLTPRPKLNLGSLKVERDGDACYDGGALHFVSEVPRIWNLTTSPSETLIGEK